MPDSIFANTTASAFNWKNTDDIQVVKLTADKDFRSEYRAYTKSGKNMLVLVDPKSVSFFTGCVIALRQAQ